jgi:hypothetical protein
VVVAVAVSVAAVGGVAAAVPIALPDKGGTVMLADLPPGAARSRAAAGGRTGAGPLAADVPAAAGCSDVDVPAAAAVVQLAEGCAAGGAVLPAAASCLSCMLPFLFANHFPAFVLNSSKVMSSSLMCTNV